MRIDLLTLRLVSTRRRETEMNSKNYTIVKVTKTLKAAEAFVAKHYANDTHIQIEDFSDKYESKFRVVAY